MTLSVDDLEIGPDISVIAEQVVSSKKKLGRPAPSAVNLATAITEITLNDTIQGSSSLTIKVRDDNWELLDSGFFDSNKDGRLDSIDLNYPAGSRLWWRLTQVSMGGGEDVEMLFMERAAVYLMSHRGPLKASRAKRTRAQFLKMLTSKVKAGGGIRLVSRELDTVQPLTLDEPAPKKTKSDRKDDKDKGISSKEKITFTNWDGSEYTFKPGELQNAELVLDEVTRHSDAGELATLATLCACIVEAPMFRNPSGGDSSSVGILQLLDIHLGGSVSARRDIGKVVNLFLTKGFTGKGGAIALARAHKDWTPGRIAQTIQGSDFPERYDKVLGGAKQVLEAYGGPGGAGSGGSDSYRKQYNFEVGSPENPRETYWDCATRLADEVNWPFFLDGNTAYFDSEMTLIKQKPVGIVDRDEEAVVDFTIDWDARHIATEVELELICDMFEFRAGEVLKLEGFGPASTGSTAKLPGRWLISEIDRTRSSLSSTFTLKQPERPLPEPISESVDREDDDSASEAGGEIAGSPKDVIDNVVLPIARECGVKKTVSENDAANARHGPTVSGSRSDHQGPPEEAWAADMSNGSSPTPEMDKLARALAKKFNVPWTGSGAVSHNLEFKQLGNKYRVQLIYRSNVGGNHYNHVHFGIRRA